MVKLTHLPVCSNSIQMQFAGWALIEWRSFKSGQLHRKEELTLSCSGQGLHVSWTVYLRMMTHPFPLVMKNLSPSLHQLISLTCQVLIIKQLRKIQIYSIGPFIEVLFIWSVHYKMSDVYHPPPFFHYLILIILLPHIYILLHYTLLSHIYILLHHI